jgi:nitroreductase
MEFFTLVRQRRSIRKFSVRAVERDKLVNLLRAAAWAPSACNQQLWHFILIEKREQKKALVREAGASRLVEKAPVVIVVCYHGGNVKEGYQSSSAAIQNLLLAAANQGLGSLWLNSYGREKRIKSLLRIPDAYLINSFVLIGYPAGALPKAPPRKPLDRICHDGVFSEKDPEVFTHRTKRWSLEDIRMYQHYFCRKTDPGETVDLIARTGRPFLPGLAGSLRGRVVDLFSYDGSLLSDFSTDALTCVDLSAETSAYTRAALRDGPVESAVLEERTLPLEDGSADFVTCFYKLERLPPSYLDELFREVKRVLAPGGRFILTFRCRRSLYALFHGLLLLAREDDIRKTAIYSFFGPYTPLSIRRVRKALLAAGFSLTCRRYFLFPPEFENIAVLFRQFRRSGGKTFLHGAAEPDALSRLAAWIVRLQGDKRLPLGSTVLIEAARGTR